MLWKSIPDRLGNDPLDLLTRQSKEQQAEYYV